MKDKPQWYNVLQIETPVSYNSHLKQPALRRVKQLLKTGKRDMRVKST